MTTQELAQKRHAEIIRLRQCGLSYRVISAQMGINQATISRHINGYCGCKDRARARTSGASAD